MERVELSAIARFFETTFRVLPNLLSVVLLVVAESRCVQPHTLICLSLN